MKWLKNSEIKTYIDEYIHSERDRAIMKRRMIDGITYETIAEEFQMSTRHIKTIAYKYTSRIQQIMEQEKALD